MWAVFTYFEKKQETLELEIENWLKSHMWCTCHGDFLPTRRSHSVIQKAETYSPCSYSIACSCRSSLKPFIYWGFLMVSPSRLLAMLCNSGRLHIWPAAPPEGSWRNEWSRWKFVRVQSNFDLGADILARSQPLICFTFIKTFPLGSCPE